MFMRVHQCRQKQLKVEESLRHFEVKQTQQRAPLIEHLLRRRNREISTAVMTQTHISCTVAVCSMDLYSLAGCVTGQSHNGKSCHTQGAIIAE